MPRFGFHQPLDYTFETFPPQFDQPIRVPGVDLPLPPAVERPGYSADDAEYLAWGRYDHDLIVGHIEKHMPDAPASITIMDFGCSSGRVLRHFHREHRERGWRLLGTDIQARMIEWIRRHFPSEFRVYVGTVLPHIPLEDNSVDVIYGISVFTHTKYLWDNWLMELRRVLKPGGLLIQTLHTENAWEFYRANRDVPWVRDSQAASLLNGGPMAADFFAHGDIAVSQVFWKREIARTFWSRYFDVLELLPPPEKWSFQDWIICRKANAR